MPTEPNPFEAFTDAELEVLHDMHEEWLDKDRHGELNGGWGYDTEKNDALSALYTKLLTVTKKRRITY
jgi:hypothetical protein